MTTTDIESQLAAIEREISRITSQTDKLLLGNTLKAQLLSLYRKEKMRLREEHILTSANIQ